MDPGRPPSTGHLARHLARQGGYAAGVIIASIALGMAGYHWIVGLPWPDAFMNTTMLLGGMGPVDPVKTTAGKVFAGVFALYSGLVFLAVTAFVLAPVFHYVLHRYHWEARHPE
jgi:hypothetical protein